MSEGAAQNVSGAWTDKPQSPLGSNTARKTASPQPFMTGNYKLTGDTGYAALMEVFHQLHCLNRIHQYTRLQSGNFRPEIVNDTQYEDIPVIPNDFRTSAIANRLHADHCIETLRLALMCHGDVTPVLIHVEPDAPLAREQTSALITSVATSESCVNGWTIMLAPIEAIR